MVRKTLPSEYYTSQSIFEKELEAFFYSQWLCAGRVDQIPTEGEYFLREIGNANVIVVRAGESVRAFYNVCRHRGTRLCEASSGKFKGRIQCSYHAWTYGLDGRLVAAPHMSDMTTFRLDENSLQSVRCEIWDGNIFINLADEVSGSLADQLGSLVAKFSPWQMQDLRLGKRQLYTIHANWKLIIQNYSECLHCPIIHPALVKISPYMSGDNEPPHRNYLGGRMDLNDGIVTMTSDGQTRRSLLPGLGEEEKRHIYYYWISPNLLLSLHPDYVMTHTIWPKAADLTEVICEMHFHRDEISKSDFSGADAYEFWDLTNRQDWRVSELSQQGIGSRGYIPGAYSNREGLLSSFDDIVLDALASLDRPLGNSGRGGHERGLAPEASPLH